MLHYVRWLFLLFAPCLLIAAHQKSHLSSHTKKHTRSTVPKTRPEETIPLKPIPPLEIELLTAETPSPATSDKTENKFRLGRLLVWVGYFFLAIGACFLAFGKPNMPWRFPHVPLPEFHFPSLRKLVMGKYEKRIASQQEREAINYSLRLCGTTFFESFMDRNNGSCHTARFNYSLKTFPKRKQIEIELFLNTQNNGGSSWGHLRHHISGEVDEILNNCFTRKSIEDCTLESLVWKKVPGKPEKALIRLRLKEEG